MEQYLAKTLAGLEEILVKEIEDLGGQNIEQHHRAVSFEADLETLYRINLWSRTALRVLKPILQFKAHNETVFYKRLRRYDWTKLFSLEETFKINSTVSSDRFTHSKFVALKTKDAIVDLFRMKFDGSRPSIDMDEPDFLIDVHCRGIDFTISIDSSGTSLHKRGYRLSNRQAPLLEPLAAGMVLLSEWDQSVPLLDPMCGSGTILVEAMMIAKNIAPRLKRKRYNFMNWDDYDPAIWQRISSEAAEAILDKKVTIRGIEKDPEVASDTKEMLLDLEHCQEIEIQNGDFFSSDKGSEEGMIICNPPYDIRLEEDDIEAFYKEMGDTLKQRYQGWSAWIISGNKEALKRIGLRTSKKRTLYNGPIECKFQRYDMYSGSKKSKWQEVNKK